MMLDGKMPPRVRRNALDTLVISIEDHLNNTLCSPHLTKTFWMMSKQLNREMECPICFCSLVPTEQDLLAECASCEHGCERRPSRVCLVQIQYRRVLCVVRTPREDSLRAQHVMVGALHTAPPIQSRGGNRSARGRRAS